MTSIQTYETTEGSVQKHGVPLLRSERAWYPMRVTYGREVKVKQALDDLGIENFLPMHYELVDLGDGNKKRMLVPAIHNLIFIYDSREISLLSPTPRCRTLFVSPLSRMTLLCSLRPVTISTRLASVSRSPRAISPVSKASSSASRKTSMSSSSSKVSPLLPSPTFPPPASVKSNPWNRLVLVSPLKMTKKQQIQNKHKTIYHYDPIIR